MKHYIITLILLTIAIEGAFGQSGSSTVYKELETKKFYSVQFSSWITNGTGTYEVNGKKVSKSTYDKYKSTWKNMEDCCPCILKSFDENEILMREAVSCGDCGVGDFKEFYPTGITKLTGSYKENPTGNWENIWDRGYCNVPDGKWTYFDESGDTLYSEFWNNGEFIEQVPEQNSNEIWKVDLTLYGKLIDDKTILTPEQVKQLVITPKYKNTSPIETQFVLEFYVSAVGHKQTIKSFTMDSFKTIDVKRILSEAKIPSNKKTIFNLVVYNNGKSLSDFYLDIKH